MIGVTWSLKNTSRALNNKKKIHVCHAKTQSDVAILLAVKVQHIRQKRKDLRSRWLKPSLCLSSYFKQRLSSTVYKLHRKVSERCVTKQDIGSPSPPPQTKNRKNIILKSTKSGKYK